MVGKIVDEMYPEFELCCLGKFLELSKNAKLKMVYYTEGSRYLEAKANFGSYILGIRTEYADRELLEALLNEGFTHDPDWRINYLGDVVKVPVYLIDCICEFARLSKDAPVKVATYNEEAYGHLEAFAYVDSKILWFDWRLICRETFDALLNSGFVCGSLCGTPKRR